MVSNILHEGKKNESNGKFEWSRCRPYVFDALQVWIVHSIFRTSKGTTKAWKTTWLAYHLITGGEYLFNHKFFRTVKFLCVDSPNDGITIFSIWQVPLTRALETEYGCKSQGRSAIVKLEAENEFVCLEGKRKFGSIY